jgi:hypothetical protein
MNMVKIKFSVLAVVLLISFAYLVSFSSLSRAETSSYNSVQVFVQTSSSLPDYFTVSAFNMTGYMVSSCQTQYPAASFELPNGQYIFTVTADQSGNNIYYSPAPVTGTNIAQSVPSMDIYEAPVVEYGYWVQQISGPTTFTVSTQNVTSYPTTTLTIQVSYANGTAAQDASVTASILGSDYYWGYETNTVMWNTTQTDGTATLVTPLAPVQIDAWNWIPVPLPQNETTITVTVAGEQVNVTVYWQPTYVGLAASTMIIPPQNSASLILQVQQPSYWVMPLGAQSTPTLGGQATTSSSPTSIPATVYQQQQGNPILKNYQAPSTTSSTTTPTPTPTSDTDPGNGLLFPIIAAASIAIAALSLAVAVRTKNREQKSKT